MNPSPPRNRGLLLFDYDGVLADSLAALTEYTSAFCRTHGIGKGFAAAAIACLESATLSGLIRAAGITEAYMRDYARFLFRELNKNPTYVPLFEGIPEMLQDLARSHTLCVVTANHSAVVQQRLEAAQLSGVMTYVYGNDEPGGKVEHIRRALESNHTNAESTWMIGDTVGDIEAAQAAGVHAVATTWGWQSYKTLNSRAPDLIFERPQALHRYFVDGRPVSSLTASNST